MEKNVTNYDENLRNTTRLLKEKSEICFNMKVNIQKKKLGR